MTTEQVKRGRSVRINATLPPRCHSRLTRFAEEEGIGLSEALRHFLRGGRNGLTDGELYEINGNLQTIVIGTRALRLTSRDPEAIKICADMERAADRVRSIVRGPGA